LALPPLCLVFSIAILAQTQAGPAVEAENEQRLGNVMLERVNNILEAAARKCRAEEGLKEAAGVGARADRRHSSADWSGGNCIRYVDVH
jgi:hypothetical protein